MEICGFGNNQITIKDYIVCADVGRGDSNYSAFHVIDIENLTQVKEYKGRINTKDFGNMLVSVTTEYNDEILINRRKQ